jgi:hypothetical protein
MTNFSIILSVLLLFIITILIYRVMFSIIFIFAILLFLVVCINLIINIPPLTEEGAWILSRYSDRLQAGQPGFDRGRDRRYFLRHSVQTGSGAHPASYVMGTGGSFPGSKAAEA